MPCRVAKRREWTGKLLLEAGEYQASTFLTLTFDDENVPLTIDHIPTLDKAQAVEYIKKFGVRYFVVGEYGDRTKRPHYHAILFGLDPITVQYAAEHSWKKGFTSAYPCTPERVQYCANYTTKKLTKAEDHRLDLGQEPEFARFSQRPQLGHKTLERTIDYFKNTTQGQKIIEKYGDIPSTYRTNGKNYAWSAYSRRKIRKGIGISQTTTELRDENPDKIPPPELMPTAEELQNRWRQFNGQTKRQKIYTQRTHQI